MLLFTRVKAHLFALRVHDKLTREYEVSSLPYRILLMGGIGNFPKPDSNRGAVLVMIKGFRFY